VCIAAHSPTLVVRGEAGVGKSALLEYAVRLEAERSGARGPHKRPGGAPPVLLAWM
jgi:predicted ATPase